MTAARTRMFFARCLLPLALAAVVASGCTRAPAQPHHVMATGAEPLRSQFNLDADKTRIVMLVAPT